MRDAVGQSRGLCPRIKQLHVYKQREVGAGERLPSSVDLRLMSLAPPIVSCRRVSGPTRSDCDYHSTYSHQQRMVAFFLSLNDLGHISCFYG